MISFTDKDIKIISETLQIKPQSFENVWSWRIFTLDKKKSLVLTIYNKVDLGKEVLGSIISVQTEYGYFEMHAPQGYMIFEPDEVIFLQYNNEHLSSLIIGSQCTCSLFNNIERNILNADFTELDPPLLLAAMQLSITENAI